MSEAHTQNHHPAPGAASPLPLLLGVALATLAALGARLVLLGTPALRWDEGWSLAHATLPWGDLWRVATEEWHPPLYAVLLKLWLVLGHSPTRIRLFSVVAGVLAVPLGAAVARAWSGRVRVALLTALLLAFWPLLVYYGQVTRMYALSVLPTLGAAWFALRDDRNATDHPSRWWNEVGLALCTTLALYTLYYTAWPLAAVWAYAALLRPRRIPRLLLAGLGVVLLYLPWLLAAGGTLAGRVSTGTAAGGNPIAGIVQFLPPTVGGMMFVYGAGWRAAGVVAVLLLAGLAAPTLGARRLVPLLARDEAQRLLLPVLAVLVSVVGVSYGAQAARWFQVRHLVPASAFLCLLLAWALDRLATRGWPLLAIGLLALGVVYWPVSTRTVYAKMLEVVDPFDPAEDYRYLAAHARPTDRIYFNILSRAGWYESYRTPRDPSWSYAQRWDPIIEPMARIAARIEGDTRAHPRLWFALYQGTFGPNAPLKDWLDAHLYPAGGEWQGKEMLYLAYAAPGATWAEAPQEWRFEQGIHLSAVRYNPAARPGGVCALELTWRADQRVPGDYKVFVHAVDEAGQLLAQHDAIPGTGEHPTASWQAQEAVPDRHGLFLPEALKPGQKVYLRVGLYDSLTGTRLRLTDGADEANLGVLEIQ